MLAKIDLSSQESVSSSLDFFSTPHTNVSFNKSVYKEFLTLNPVSDPPFHFKVQSGSSFIDLRSCYILTEWTLSKKPTGEDWQNITDADNISVIQGIGSNFIGNMKINVSGKEAFNANNLYAFKSYLDQELTYSDAAKRTHLAVTGYYPVVGADQNDVADAGFTKRRACFEGGRTAQFLTNIDAGLFNQSKLFINNTDIEIEIVPLHLDFLVLAPALVNTTQVKLTITACKLYVKFMDVMDGLALNIAQRHLRSPVKYEIKRSDLKTMYMESGRNELNANIFHDQIPRQVICCMLSRDDYIGTRVSSPFRFRHFDLRNIQIDWNGQTTPGVPYNMDFANRKVTRAYHDMMNAAGYAFVNESNGITFEKFISQWCIFIFNLSSDLENNNGCELIRHGTTSLHAQFAQPIPVGGVTMIIYGLMDSLLMIDNSRNVTTDTTLI